MSQALRFGLKPTVLALPLLLVACGGSDDSGTDPNAPVTPLPVACAPFVDSFGRSVTCDEMRQLSGSIWGFVEPGGDAATGAGDAAADGTVADGGPVANTVVEFKDQRSRIARATTDANGYFRISLRGLTPPLTASAVNYYQGWKSMMVSPVVRAPANRQFYTVNLTGLTHGLATDVAKKAGLTTVADLQPSHVAAQKDALPGLVTSQNAVMSQVLSLAGLPLPFNPLTTPFLANGLTGYDRVLRSISITNSATGVTAIGTSGLFYAKGCALTSFTGLPAQGGGYATMSMESDGGFCGLPLYGDSEGKVPAQGGRLLTQPTKGTVVFVDGNRMSYTPLYGSSGTDVFSFEMSATLNSETVPLVVQMTMNITKPSATR